MSYVPIVVPTQQPPSPRTRELADLLARVVVDFEQRHPSMTSQEVRAATRLAAQATHGTGESARVLALVVGGLTALIAGIVLFLSQAAGGPVTGGVDVPIVVVAVLIGIVALVAIALRRAP